jgi:hypothetical protein
MLRGWLKLVGEISLRSIRLNSTVPIFIQRSPHFAHAWVFRRPPASSSVNGGGDLVPPKCKTHLIETESIAKELIMGTRKQPLHVVMLIALSFDNWIADLHVKSPPD